MNGGLLIAGFDAGQTHTRCRLALFEGDQHLRPLAEGEGSGVSHLDAPEGEARFTAAIASSFSAASAALPQGANGAAIAGALSAAAIGASGIETGSSLQPRAQRLAASALALPLERVQVSGDELTALEGARGDAPAGILLISGTGCIGLGRNARGQQHRCAGWGWLLDGAGSAADIGRDGLALSLQMADGRHPDSPMRQALWAALELASDDPAAAEAIKARVVAPGFGAAGLARLAPVVHQQALAADPDALTIVQRSAEALALMATTIATRLHLDAPPVWPAGGALEHLPLLRQGLVQSLAQRCPQAALAPPAGDGCDGALQLAVQLLRRR